MKSLLVLLLTAGSLIAQVQHVQVRVISFEKPGATTALAAAVPDCDESLYAGLVADTVAGRAKRVQDQTVIIRGGQRSKAMAIREYPSTNESDPEPSEWVHYPSSFTFYNLGQTLEAEVTVGELEKGAAAHPLDINFAPEWSSLLALHPWPVPDFRGSGQMGRMLHPVIAVHRPQLQVLTWTGRNVLVSVSPAPQASMTSTDDIPYRYTFLRAGLNGEKPALARGVPSTVEERRLHTLSIRLPRDEAAALLLQHASDDAALYAQMCRRIADGSATLSGHAAILVRQGRRSKIDSVSRFSYSRGYYELIPDSWFEMSLGCDMEVEAMYGRSVLMLDKDGKSRYHRESSPEEDGEGTGGQ